MTGHSNTKKLPKPKLKPTLHNAFAILSQHNNPTGYSMSCPLLKMDNDKTVIPPDPREHRRQHKIARRHHIKRTLRCLWDSNDLFLDDSITLAEDERITVVKANKSNMKRMAINAAHTKRGMTNIGFAQRGHNAVYSLGSTFNRTIKRSTRTSMPDSPQTTEYIITSTTNNPSW